VVTGLSESDVKKITQFYNNRYQEKGNDIAAVGWKDQATQYLRFNMLFRDYDPTGKIILDVGCGFGDLARFLTDIYGPTFQYIGIDISSELIQQAKQTHKLAHCCFYESDLFSLKKQTQQSIDYAVESGMLSFKVENNNQYAQEVMEEMFAISQEGIALNFLTDRVDYKLAKNHHFSAAEVTQWASKLTSSFTLYHDYPLWEFTIRLLKSR